MRVRLQNMGRNTSDPRTELVRARLSITGWYGYTFDILLKAGEYQVLGAALIIGAEKTDGHLEVEVDGITEGTV